MGNLQFVCPVTINSCVSKQDKQQLLESLPDTGQAQQKQKLQNEIAALTERCRATSADCNGMAYHKASMFVCLFRTVGRGGTTTRDKGVLGDSHSDLPHFVPVVSYGNVPPAGGPGVLLSQATSLALSSFLPPLLISTITVC